MKKRIFSRVLALFMALAMLSTTALADVSFDDLQEAIDGTNDVTVTDDTKPVENIQTADKMPEISETDTADTGAAPADESTETTEPEDTTHVNGALVRTDDNGTNYFGYGWSSVTENESTTWYYAIEAHDEAGNRFVVLLDDVSKGNGTANGVVIGQDGSSQNVTIDMKGHDITGNDEGAVITVKENAELNLNNGTISGGEIGIDVFGTLILDSVTVTKNGTGIKANSGSKVTLKGDKNSISGNTTKDLTGNGRVTLKVAVGTDSEKTYTVDADTAEVMMKEPASSGTNWTLFKGKDDSYVVAYTGSGDKDNQLTYPIVNSVLNAASADSKRVTGFAIPEGVKEIGNDAFGYGNGKTLQSISLPEGLIRIGERAFSSCGNLKSITIPGSVKEIGMVTFYRCYALEEVVLSEGLAKIPGQVFRELQSLKTIKIPTTVTEVDEKAFFDCGIKSIWVYAEGDKDGSSTIEALKHAASNRNIFAVTDENTTLYRDGNVVSFTGNDKDATVNADGSVSVPTGKIAITSNNNYALASVDFSNAATVVVGDTGNLTIPCERNNVGVTVNDTRWTVNGGEITIKTKWNPTHYTTPSISGSSTITGSDGASITAPAGAGISTNGAVTINKGDITYTDKDNNTVAITPGSGVRIDPDGTVFIPGSSSVNDDNGKTSYPIGATMKDGQITSAYNVVFENESENKIVVMPAEVEEGGKLVPVTVDPVTGTITVPNGGSVTMNDGKNVVSYPDGATVDRQGSAASNSNVVEYVYEKSSGTVTTPVGSKITVGSDGTITVPEGSTIAGVEYPYGATILPNGDILENSAPRVELPEFTFDDGTTGTGDGDDTTTIDDEAIPLAGLISRAQLVSYLYAHEGSPDGEDAEGEYTLAWAWAVENEIEDKDNDPEEIVTGAILREVMTAYAEFLGTTFDVVIGVEDDMPVMNCDEILAEFFASLEDKAA